jgi:CheY-like chemotaxis protein
MPLCDGLDATKKIRKIETTTKVTHLPLSHVLNTCRSPILSVSASVYDSDITNCIRAGMDGFVKKPIDMKLLNSILKSSIDLSEIEKHVISETGASQDVAWFRRTKSSESTNQAVDVI